MENKIAASRLPAVLRFKKITAITFLTILYFFTGTLSTTAQEDTLQKIPPADMATLMRSNGKIYVVVAVLTIILTGLFFYLIRLDRKINRLEKSYKTE